MNQRCERRLHQELARVTQRRVSLETNASTVKVTVYVRGIGTVVVTYPPEYPFRPPVVVVNGLPYARFLRIDSPRFQSMYSHMYAGRCCCVSHNSITSKENWSPAHQLRDILDEVERFHHDKCRVAYTLIVNRIKERHQLPEDVPLLAFL